MENAKKTHEYVVSTLEINPRKQRVNLVITDFDVKMSIYTDCIKDISQYRRRASLTPATYNVALDKSLFQEKAGW